MHSFCRAASTRPRVFWRTAAALIAVLAAAAGVRPLAAADCGECDAACQLTTDAFALMESYAQDKGAFAARSRRCSTADERWSEILENLERLDQPPPANEDTRLRQVSKLELAMINHEIGIASCMQFCGLEQYRDFCVGGPGGMSCECKPGAFTYCRSEANRSAIDTIAPGFAGAGPSGPVSPSPPDAEAEVEEAHDPGPEAESDDGEARYMIEVAVSADGFEPETVFAPCNFEPSSVTVHGRVMDDGGLPVAGARVSLGGLGAEMTTDERGFYSLRVTTEGDTPFTAVRDVMIVRLVRDLRASVEPVGRVWANGREFEAVLAVTAEGRPLAGREVTLTGWKGFSHGGNSVDYVTEARSNHHTLRLDGNGQARVRLRAPIVPLDRGATLQNPGGKFPVQGHLRVKVRGQEAETEASYQVASPFPKIGHIRVPGNVDAGLWQVSPSFIVIDDPDSDRFRVTVRGLGDFRTTVPGAATKAGILTHELAGHRFEFLYRPPQTGLDPTAMPDVLDQFMKTSKNIYLGATTNLAGGMLIDKVQVVFPSDGFGNALTRLGLELDAGKLLDAGGNVANVVNLGSGTYLDSMTVAEDSGNTQKQIVAGGNLLIGVVDTSMGFIGTLTTLEQKAAWEAAKAYWEYVKLMNSLTNQYQELAEAYQGTRFYPIEVTVEDESGHRTTASRACSVREWVGASK